MIIIKDKLTDNLKYIRHPFKFVENISLEIQLRVVRKMYLERQILISLDIKITEAHEIFNEIYLNNKQ